MTLKRSSYVLAWLLYVSIYPSLVRQQIPMTGKESTFKMTGNIKLTQKFFHFYFLTLFLKRSDQGSVLKVLISTRAKF